ncbi:hypothetical protein X777_11031 [Ooceraea biroi]|uniref:Uncharacterized protein n=1 Tax=Ooceraea biroi TaxID=2015173 RepID=A0A026W3L6_OOCBI|nr:hypothetical protein X777_11031 [Ooceraea biroi]
MYTEYHDYHQRYRSILDTGENIVNTKQSTGAAGKGTFCMSNDIRSELAE